MQRNKRKHNDEDYEQQGVQNIDSMDVDNVYGGGVAEGSQKRRLGGEYGVYNGGFAAVPLEQLAKELEIPSGDAAQIMQEVGEAVAEAEKTNNSTGYLNQLYKSIPPLPRSIINYPRAVVGEQEPTTREPVVSRQFFLGIPQRQERRRRLHDRVDNNTQDVKSDKQIQNIIRFRQEVKRRYVNTARKNKNEFVLLAAKTFLVSSAVIFGASILYDVIFGSGKLNTDSTDQTSNSLSMR